MRIFDVVLAHEGIRAPAQVVVGLFVETHGRASLQTIQQQQQYKY